MAANKSQHASGGTTIGSQEAMGNPGVEILQDICKLYFGNSDTIENPEEDSSSLCESLSSLNIVAAGNSGNKSSFSSGPFTFSNCDVTKNSGITFSPHASFTSDSCEVIKNQGAKSMVASEYITLGKSNTVLNPKVQFMDPFGSNDFPRSDSKKNSRDKSSSNSGVFTFGNSDSMKNPGAISSLMSESFTFGKSDAVKNQGFEFMSALGNSTLCNSDAKKTQIGKSSSASGNFGFDNYDSTKNAGDKSSLFNIDAIKNSKVEGPLVSGGSTQIREAATKNPEDKSSSVSGTFTFDKSETTKNPFSVVTRGPSFHASDERVGVMNPNLNGEGGSGVKQQPNLKTCNSWSDMFQKAAAILDGRKYLKEISIPSCNAERPESPGRLSNSSAVQLQRKQITHKETERSKVEARQTSRKIPTAGALTRTLSLYPKFSAKISDLEMQNGLSPTSVYSIASIHSHVFSLNKELISLEPRVAFCLDHKSEKGCQNPSICKKIHICPAYVSGTCSEKHCYLGHFWHTDHNLLILDSFFIAKLSSFELSNLFQTQGKVNRFSDSLKICNEYNQFSCANMDCKELHICLDFVLGITKCKKEFCFLNHDILNTQCRNILKTKGISSNESARDVVLALHQAIPSLKEKIHCPSRHNLLAKQQQTV